MSLSGDSFSIKTTDGRSLMEVKGKAFSMSGRKMVTDMRGNHLFTLRKKAFSLGTGTYYAQDPQEKKFFVIKWKFRSKKRVVELDQAHLANGATVFGNKDIGTFENSITKQPVSFLMKGGLFDSGADIKNVANNQPVARIDRKRFNAAEVFGNKQTYVVTCAKGIDMAIVAAMCICLDEKRNDKNKNNNVSIS